MAEQLQVRVKEEFDREIKSAMAGHGYTHVQQLLHDLLTEFVAGKSKAAQYGQIHRLKPEHRRVILELADFIHTRPDGVPVLEAFLSFAGHRRTSQAGKKESHSPL